MTANGVDVPCKTSKAIAIRQGSLGAQTWKSATVC